MVSSAETTPTQWCGKTSGQAVSDPCSDFRIVFPSQLQLVLRIMKYNAIFDIWWWQAEDYLQSKQWAWNWIF